MEFVVYALINSETKKIYIGQTIDLEKRIGRHNGLLASSTKSYTSRNKSKGIWQLGYKEVLKTRKEAIIREKELKSYQGRQFLKVKLGR